MICNDGSHEGLCSTDRIPGWEYPLTKSFARAIAPDKPTTGRLTTFMDDCFGQVLRALAAGLMGQKALTLLLRLLIIQLDRTGTGARDTNVHNFVVPNGTPVFDFTRAFLGVVSPATGTERGLLPGIFGYGVEAVWHFGQHVVGVLLYTLSSNKTPSINGEKYFCLPASSKGVRSSAPSGPCPSSTGRGQARALPQSPAWQTGSCNNPHRVNVHKSIPDCFDPWLDTASNFWPLEEHHYAEVHAVCMSIQTEDALLRSSLLSSSARAAALSETRGRCLNCHEDSHSLRQCRHPFKTLAVF